ncbi:Bug family tripartite tricarboxylate transporter substrate binding protein [Bordetella bronchiseptica]|uniref:Bug family tripartite tricarboxylate transporter substrate binding protein n=1 Tax=Bordetella bronchiseptica TaxID=518 RepID=UPI00028AA207|nr:tripartite tricarboxylate transporter substrate binding protein BugE [Bordetella bronchiseptica]KDD61736.1 tripartite tricarboxylate transporter family receptor [Bordetella bronchiseptica OSU553]AUL16303.1 ABC transporter substrate-binding protein [Bordetella bronchiseptica]AWP59529.1 ABC transporter substrate-binding protein [Bordetella bronchiseptica]AWQ06180.1 ABC transporter substrate-binding protein [Bordetella bronchiseptica]KAK50362.1 tripartite tricarboxylate transporter family rece
MQRRNVILGLSLAAILAAPLAAGVAHAQDAYPNKPIRLIVPFPPGGTTDIVGRLFADKLSKELGQTVVVENRGGAGGSIGSAFVASSAPDGYVLGIATVSTHGINPAIYTNLPFDAEKDFTPISNLAAVPNIMVVNPKVPAKTIEDFIKLAKSQPGKLTYASAGNGSVSHMMGEMFKMASGTDLMHVPYRGVGPALNDTLAGQVDVLYDNLPSSLPHVQSGALVPLAVAAPQRVAALPNVPTFAEAGLQPVNDSSWFGLVAPAKVPQPVIDKLYAAVVKVSAEDDVKKRLEGLGAAPVANTPAEYAKQISEEIAKNKRIAKEANVKID